MLGCTHLTELAQVLPTAAIQAFANDVIKTRDGADDDCCRTVRSRSTAAMRLRADGPAVAMYYPRWVAKAASSWQAVPFFRRSFYISTVFLQISIIRREASMKIHEYQGKEILRKFGVTVPRGIPCMSVEEAVKAAETLGGPVWVVKAQIHAGGRGKGGGVKVAKSLEQVKEYAEQIMGMQLVTHQTSPEGQKVRRLLVEEGADIKKELYVSMVTDRVSQKVVLMASSEGGMDIEEVAHSQPGKNPHTSRSIRPSA